MNVWLIIPPIAFLVVLAAAWLEYRGLALLRSGEKWPDRPGRDKSYACGENISTHRVQPDYSQFFPFAYFFTIMHVVALMSATVPSSAPAVAVAVLYLVGAAVGLFILFRR
jgi:hypothetical protein